MAMTKKDENNKPLTPQLRQIYTDQLLSYLKSNKFNSLDEMQAFIQENITGKRIDEVVPAKRGKLSKEEQSKKLVIQAMELEGGDNSLLLKEALNLWPENPRAHLYLGENEPDVEMALVHFKRATEYALKHFGGMPFIEENVGFFWGLHQTRIYMDARNLFSQCLVHLQRYRAGIYEMEALMKLNPSDNQGIRYRLGALFIQEHLFDKFEELYKIFGKENTTMMNFNYALYLFVKHGSTQNALKALKKAKASNKYVVSYLIGKLEMPDSLPDSYSLGDHDEAIIYVDTAIEAWHNCGAMAWLYKFEMAN